MFPNKFIKRGSTIVDFCLFLSIYFELCMDVEFELCQSELVSIIAFKLSKETGTTILTLAKTKNTTRINNTNL